MDEEQLKSFDESFELSTYNIKAPIAKSLDLLKKLAEAKKDSAGALASDSSGKK